jgi:stage II sporulation protein D
VRSASAFSSGERQPRSASLGRACLMTRRRIRKPLLLVAALALALTAAAGSGGAARSLEPVWAPATLVFNGRGWGHGVGMSQWGAYGYAMHGLSYQQILAHYYPGTTLGTAPPSKLRVLLAQGRKRLTISSETPFHVSDASGAMREPAELSVVLDGSLSIPLAGGKQASLEPPLVFTAGSTPLELGGRPYRGSFRVDLVNGKLRLVNVVGLEAYLDGVVPAEVPDDWPTEALRAQAVAARTYALAFRKVDQPFDLYSDVRDQLYLGIASEAAATTQAVSDTAGKVVLYDGAPALTYFFSSSGGKTSAIQDAWPDAKPLPYLVSVDDPYDTYAPNHRWGPVVLSGALLAKSLKISGVVVDARPRLNGSGRAAFLLVTCSDGTTVSIAAGTVRAALNLRSTWFSVGSIALQRPAAALTYGSRLALAGRARSVGASLALEEKPAGEAWSQVGALTRAADGSFRIDARPTSNTQYRVVAGTVTSAPIGVLVAPEVTLTSNAGMLAGTVRPALEGATVELQRDEDGSWTTVATTSLAADGSFSAALDLTPGSYRARAAPPGFAAGLSESLQIG